MSSGTRGADGPAIAPTAAGPNTADPVLEAPAPAVLYGQRGPLRCALCRCPATERVYGIAVCSWHGEHGEDGPDCPRCVAHLVKRSNERDRRVVTASAPPSVRSTLCGAPATPRDILANDARNMSPGSLRSFNVCGACLDAAAAARAEGRAHA